MLGSCSWKIHSPETNTATTDDQRASYMGKYIRLLFEHNKTLYLFWMAETSLEKIAF